MQVLGVSGLHKVTRLPEANKDYQLTQYTSADELVTIQSVFIKAPESQDTRFIFKTQKTGDTRSDVMNITVPANSTKVISVKQQLPASFCMFARASAPGSAITINGITTKLG